jgi:tRNA(Ile)-lysidine synthase
VSSTRVGPWPDEVTALLPLCTFPPPGVPITCAVSGGADSLALLVLAVAHDGPVTAVHVDHGLRPGSEQESHLVAQTAAWLGADFEKRTVAVSDGANLEARARAARFSVLPLDVATGHTMDDQAETVLANMLRGAGLDGAAAMAPGHRHPLLALRRRDTEAVCRAMALVPFEDPSNIDRRFLRNRIRHELLPLCHELAERDMVPVLARQAQLARDEAAFLDLQATAALPDPSDARTLRQAPLPLARRAVRQWLRQLGQPYPPSMAEVSRVLQVANGEIVGTELAGGRRVRRRGGRLFSETDWPEGPGQPE